MTDLKYALVPTDGFLQHAPGRFVDGRLLARLADTRLPSLFEYETNRHSFTELSPDFNAYHILNWLVYLASNELLPYTRNNHDFPSWYGLLDMLVYRIPRKIVTAVFASNYLSIRAAWENALNSAFFFRHAKAGVFLIEMALDQHFDWIQPIIDTKVIFYVIEFESVSLLRKLLEKGARPCLVRIDMRFSCLETVIIAAARKQAWECVRLLLENCDIHADLPFGFDIAGETKWTASHFQLHFQYVGRELSTSWMVDPDDGLCFISQDARSQILGPLTKSLGLFLQAGADIDLPYFSPVRDAKREPIEVLQYFHSKSMTPPEWVPTCLDISLYWDEQLFGYLQSLSNDYNSPRRATRAAICQAILKGGNAALDQYFTSKCRPVQEVLELLLAEQFFTEIPKPDDPLIRVNARLARLFIEYGIAINSRVVQDNGGVSLLLRRLVMSARQFGLDEDVRFILIHLLRNGAIIGERTLRFAVHNNGIQLLELLAKHGANIERDGKLALLAAVAAENYQAVEWLLYKGVSIASEFLATNSSLPNVTLIGMAIFGAAGRIKILGPLEPCSRIWAWPKPRMLRFLLSKGAHLKLHASDPNPYRFFMCDDVFEAWQRDDITLMIEHPTEMAKISVSEWKTIYARWGCEIACNQQVFDFFMSQHQEFDPGFVLAAAIRYGKSRVLAHRLLDTSSNLNLYSGRYIVMTPLQAAAATCNLHLVQALIDRGANINAPARQGDLHKGRTALQAICAYAPSTIEQAKERNSLIWLLIDKGADYHDVLNDLARCGDIENMASLLERGVDPNYVHWTAAGSVLYGYSPLDISADHHRLDMFHLLLNSGGLSANPGPTGYEYLLGSSRSSVIQEVMQRHVNQMEVNFSQCPGLRKKHQDLVNQQARRREQAAHRLGVAL